LRSSLALLSLLLIGATPASPPVIVGKAGPDLDACLSVGEVGGFKDPAKSFLSVRTALDTRAREIDRLKSGHWVVMCDDAKDGAWTGIVYAPGDDREMDCGTGSPVESERPYDGPCKSGWVSSKYIKIIAG
jgi:hypothetical protein